ncbi:hypothetical protein BTO20_15900 [Mycobacterium dioxanotrophicus]|uniref:Uncharacterized protein n=2 Tax=Mycobacterium TaxID=1763 RepID=A0A1Y0C3V1_9MYCO|nr:hypothetical protein BTO20_15900 [Mycobacterium dioxanotrophicus]ORA29898.1 hypothetical protein BST13_26515 [Mycobacterium aquaticum]
MVFAVVMPVAVFAWMAGNKHNKRNPAKDGKIGVAANEEPAPFGQCEAWSADAAANAELHRQKPAALRPEPVGTDSPTSTTVWQRRPPNSATTQWDRADTMLPASLTSQARRTADPKESSRPTEQSTHRARVEEPRRGPQIDTSATT